MKVLVTGGCGYIGSYLTPFLLADGHQVTAFDTQWFGAGDPAHNDSLTVIQADVRDLDAYKEAVKGQDAVIWLASLSNNDMCVSYPELTEYVNAGAFKRCYEVTKVERFIYASSVAAYGSSLLKLREDMPLSPSTPYGIQKAECEDVAKDATIVRSASVCGVSANMRFDTTVNKMTNDACRNGHIVVNGGEQIRSHVHMRDLVDFYRLLLKAPINKIKGEVFNVVGEDQNQSVFKTATIVAEITSAKVLRRNRTDNRSYAVDGAKATRVLDFTPKMTVDMAVREMAVRFKAGYWKDSLTSLSYQRMRHDLV